MRVWTARLLAKKAFEGKHDVEFRVEHVEAESALEALKRAKDYVRKHWPELEFDQMQATEEGGSK